MLALCLILLVTYYALNYAGMIGWGLRSSDRMIVYQTYSNNPKIAIGDELILIQK